MNKSNRKKIFFGILSPILLSNDYEEYLDGDDPTYVARINNVVISFGFNFFSSQEIASGPLNITHYDVEDYILDIGIPTNNLIQQKRKEKYHLSTVANRKLPHFLEWKPLETPEEVEAFAHAYIEYLENEGQTFIDQYSYLPCVLKEMDRLMAEGEDWNGILSGMGDRLFRGIIISKLCNDPNYNKKFEYCEMKFSTVSLLDEWQPYWAKLKEVLPGIQPKYNV